MGTSEEIRSLLLTLAVYGLLFALKLAVYLTTGVLALLAEAFHTLSDIFVAGFLLVATIYSHKEADSVHMFGYGRAQNVAALVAATLFISFTSLELYRKALPRLFQAEATTYQNLPLAVGVLTFSMLIAAVPLVRLVTRPERGAAAKAQLLELVNDQLGLLAALVGTVFILAGQPYADPIATTIVATIIAYNGLTLFRENLSFLLGRSPGREYLAQVEQLARSVPGVLAVRDLRAEYIGPGTIHAGLRITVRRGLPVEEASRIADEVHRRIHQDASSGYCVIRTDAAEPLDQSSLPRQAAVPTNEGDYLR
jgi:cation diffusion facilitator family transporter